MTKAELAAQVDEFLADRISLIQLWGWIGEHVQDGLGRAMYWPVPAEAATDEGDLGDDLER